MDGQLRTDQNIIYTKIDQPLETVFCSNCSALYLFIISTGRQHSPLPLSLLEYSLTLGRLLTLFYRSNSFLNSSILLGNRIRRQWINSQISKSTMDKQPRQNSQNRGNASSCFSFRQIQFFHKSSLSWTMSFTQRESPMLDETIFLNRFYIVHRYISTKAWCYIVLPRSSGCPFFFKTQVTMGITSQIMNSPSLRQGKSLYTGLPSVSQVLGDLKHTSVQGMLKYSNRRRTMCGLPLSAQYANTSFSSPQFIEVSEQLLLK